MKPPPEQDWGRAGIWCLLPDYSVSPTGLWTEFSRPTGWNGHMYTHPQSSHVCSIPAAVGVYYGPTPGPNPANNPLPHCPHRPISRYDPAAFLSTVVFLLVWLGEGGAWAMLQNINAEIDTLATPGPLPQ